MDQPSHRRGRGDPEAQRNLGPVGAAALPESLGSRDRSRGRVRLSNKGMEQTNGALAGMEAPFAAHPRCSPDTRGVVMRRHSGYNLARCRSRSSWPLKPSKA